MAEIRRKNLYYLTFSTSSFFLQNVHRTKHTFRPRIRPVDSPLPAQAPRREEVQRTIVLIAEAQISVSAMPEERLNISARVTGYPGRLRHENHPFKRKNSSFAG
jgi:hypothetical protein